MKRRSFILLIIVISQFCCTSLWFAGNGVMVELVETFSLAANSVGHLTAVVQFGFIVGTLVFALLTIADRFSPSKVFFTCAVLGAAFNAGIISPDNTWLSLLLLRFLTGFFLAGIYPVGMKIAADYFEKGLGRSLGFLVGALVLGTAFPHLLKGAGQAFPWQAVLLTTSSLAVLGGVLMLLLVPDGPHRKSGTNLHISAAFTVFKHKKFRAAAFGYFGHMWELYAFWAFVPLLLESYTSLHPEAVFNIPVWSFLIIGIGGLACVAAGIISQKTGTQSTAFMALLLSCGCCLLSPLIFMVPQQGIFIGFMLFWGVVVIADSPLFSTLVAQHAAPEVKGSALTIVNCIGFAITIVSIQLISSLHAWTGTYGIYALLAVGPVFGLIALKREKTAVAS